MILTDVHNHSTFSADGRSPLVEMVDEARKKGLRYFGVSEHFDYDYLTQGVLAQGEEVPMIDAEGYFTHARALQKRVNGENFTFLAGAEFGYAPLAQCHAMYEAVVRNFQPDFVVNSIHTLDGFDCYFPEAFVGKEQRDMYSRYLLRVRESLDVPYRYDIVAHLGYVSRNAPYADRKLRLADYRGVIEDILRTVIKKEKILEINSSSKGAGSDFLPDVDILERYYELGGRLVSFASDSHDTLRIADRRETVVAALKKIGFTHITVPCKGEYIQVEL